MRHTATHLASLLLLAASAFAAAAQTPPAPVKAKPAAAAPAKPAPTPASAGGNPFFVHENITRRLSEHVWEIPDMNRPGVPNVAIVVGTRATLIVDTGMGVHGGTAITHEAQKLSKNTEFYLATTDFRPEHITGGMALPPNTKWVIPAAQKVEIDQTTQSYIDSFVARSADLREALQDVKLREPDILFDRTVKIDLGGGVKVQLFWYGPARTNGDLVVYVEPDRLLHSGNLLSSKTYPAMPDQTANVTNWLDAIDRLEALKPLIVLPNHGELRDAALISGQRTVLRDLQKRSLELKAEGNSPEKAGGTLTAEFDAKYPDWKGLGNIPAIVRRFYEQ